MTTIKNNLFLIAIFASLLMISVARGEFKPEYTEYTLPNGLQVILVEDHRFPLVDFRLLYESGSVDDLSETSGLANLTLQMLKEGTENYPGDELMNAVDSIGGRFEVNASREALIIDGNFLSRDMEFGLNILGEMVMRPTFEKADLAHLKRNAMSRLMQYKSVVENRLANRLYRTIYGNRGYGLDPFGSRAGIRKIDTVILENFYNTYLVPNNAILGISGDFKQDEVKKVIKSTFGVWSKGPGSSKPSPDLTPQDTLRLIIIDNPDAPSTEFIIGREVPPIGSDDAAPLYLLDYVLGGSREISRLSKALISEQGLVSRIYSGFQWSNVDGLWIVYGVSSNDMGTDAILNTLEVMEDLKNIRVSVQELTRAVNYFHGIMLMFYETPNSTMDGMTRLYNLGVGPEFNEELLKRMKMVNPAKLKKIANDYLDINKMTIVISGPESQLRKGLSQLAPVEVITTGEN